jgi:hypothetical protein
MPEQPAVLSLNVQAAMPQDTRRRSQFEIMVRHLFDRMLNNEAFGEDASARMTELAGAIAFPPLLVSLFLLPAYHLPPPFHLPRSLMSQTCDHLFFCTYSFVVLGLAMIFQWDTLFPDVLDIYVLTSLPIERRRMLWGRISALAIFLGLVQVETSTLGTIFFPGTADLQLGYFHHLYAHAMAVTVSGAFAVALFLALQGLLACMPFPALANRLAAIAKIISVIVLLMTLFLFPLAAHSIEALLAPPALALWIPPFWFLGVYEALLYGSTAQPIFHQLAQNALLATSLFSVAGIVLYPFAYTRRVRQLVEGTGKRSGASIGLLHRPLHAIIARTPAARAIFHFVAQTLGRLPRLHLYLAMYTGVGLALIVSELLYFQTNDGTVHIVVPADGVRMVIPLVAFWTVMGLRTALLSPLLLKGSWLFRVIDGKPSEASLRAARAFVFTVATSLILATVVLLGFIEPLSMRTVPITATELLLGLGLSLLLTDLVFLPTRTIPFTTARIKTIHQLPTILIIYLLVFPYLALKVQRMDLWDSPTPTHLVAVAITFLILHAFFLLARRRVISSDPAPQEFLYLGLGLRDE